MPGKDWVVESSCQPIPGHFMTANRDTSSKPPRFIRRWRRFGDFQNLGFGGIFCILFAAAGKKYVAEGHAPVIIPSAFSRYKEKL